MTSRVPVTAVLIVLSVFAGLTGVRLAYTLAYLMLLILVVSLIWVWWLARKVRVTRVSPRGSYTVGEIFEEQFTVTNGAAIPLPFCEVNDHSQVRSYHPDRVCALGPRDTVSWRARGTFDRRGIHHFGPLTARMGDPFGLFERTVAVSSATDVLVYPQIHHIDDSVVDWAGGGFESSRHGRPRDLAPDVSGIRDYVAGDAFNRIHWASSARTSKLMSRVFDTSQSSDQLILLDLERGSHVGTAPESTLEYAVSLCASLVHAGLRRGRAVGLIANDREGTAIGAGRGDSQRLRILEFLALAHADGYIPLAELIGKHGRTWKGRGGLTVITASRDPQWVSSLIDVGVRGQRHLAVVLDPTTFGAAGSPLKLSAASRLAVNWWVVHRGDRFDRSPARAVGS